MRSAHMYKCHGLFNREYRGLLVRPRDQLGMLPECVCSSAINHRDQVEEAFCVLEAMREKHVTPDAFVFRSLITVGCSSAICAH